MQQFSYQVCLLHYIYRNKHQYLQKLLQTYRKKHKLLSCTPAVHRDVRLAYVKESIHVKEQNKTYLSASKKQAGQAECQNKTLFHVMLPFHMQGIKLNSCSAPSLSTLLLCYVFTFESLPDIISENNLSVSRQHNDHHKVQAANIFFFTSLIVSVLFSTV